MAFRALRIRLNCLGALALLAYTALAALSYAQAPALWLAEKAPRAGAFLARLAQDVPLIALSRHFGNHTAVVIAYAIPLALASAAALAALWLLMRERAPAEAAVGRLVFHWSLAFGGVSCLGFPAFTQDFWLSMAWGRMVAAAENPYHSLFAAEQMAGLPLDHFPMLMSYGPLWALLSGAVMAVAGSSVLAAAILFKVLLAAAWIGALVLVHRLARETLGGFTAPAVAAFGWTPLGATQSLIEGHNDIAMSALALLWLALLLRGRSLAPVALAASIVAKYATAPLFLVDAIYTLRRAPGQWRSYVVRMIVPVLVVATVVAIFYRSPQFFEGLRVVGGWHFLRPVDAVEAIEDFLGFDVVPLTYAALAFFPIVAAYSLLALFRRPCPETLAKAALAVMCCILFAAASHVWPWYLVWILGPAALIPHWWLSRFAIGMAVLAPFTVAHWWVPALDDELGVGALAMYAGAALWTLATRRIAARAWGIGEGATPAATGAGPPQVLRKESREAAGSP